MWIEYDLFLLFRCILKEEALEDILRNYDNKVVPIQSFDGKVLVFHMTLRAKLGKSLCQ